MQLVTFINENVHAKTCIQISISSTSNSYQNRQLIDISIVVITKER